MKKILVISGLMMAAIVALTGCQPKNVAEQLPERVLTVAAFTDDGTKAYNDGLSVLWAEDDALSMFYSNPEGGYLSAGKFTISDGVGTKRGIFTGTAPELAAGSYDWYAIYPYNAKLTTPASTDASGGYVYVGRKGGMYQPEYDANIPDYTVCPMYGVCKGVQAGDAPAFTIKQMTSIIELNIVNSTGKTVKINYAELDETESGEMITGTFYADITADPPVLSGDDPQYVSPLSRTIITNPGELAPGETAKIYLTVKPFTHDSSKAFKVRISGYVGEDTATTVVELNPAADKCTFHPGKIKKVTVPLENVEIKDGNSVADVVNGTVGDSYIVKDALVTMVYNKGFFATDGVGTILVYMSAAPAVAKGDKVDIDGVSSTYSNMVQFNRPTVTVKSKENPVSMPEPLIYTGTEVDAAAAAPTNAYVIVTATMTSATAATVEGATATLSVNAGTDPAISLEQGKTYKLTGYVYGYYNGKVYLYADSAEEVGDTPGPGPDPDTIAKALAGEAGTSYEIASATIVSQVKGNLFVSDGTGVILVYNKNNTLTKGQKISFSGKTKAFNNLLEFENPTITVLEGTESVSLDTENWTDGQMAGAYGQGNAKIAYVSYTATLSSATNGIIPGSEAILYLSKADGVSTSQNKTYVLTGFVYGWTDYTKNDVTTKEVCMYVEKAEDAQSGAPDPDLKLNGSNSATVSFDAVPAGSQEVTVTCDNKDWTVTGAPEWVTVQTDKENSKILVSVSENTGDKRQAELAVNHSNGELVRTLTVIQAGKSSGETGSNTSILSNADIVSAGAGASGYQDWSITNSEGKIFNAHAIKNQHSKATSAYHYLQIKKITNDEPFFIQIPELGTKIISIKMTVSNASKAMDGGGNTATLFFSDSNSTSADGDGVASGVGSSTVTIDASALNMNTGFITASGAVRIWDIEISYD